MDSDAWHSTVVYWIKVLKCPSTYAHVASPLPSTVMSGLLCIRIAGCRERNISELLQNAQSVCFNS